MRTTSPSSLNDNCLKLLLCKLPVPAERAANCFTYGITASVCICYSCVYGWYIVYICMHILCMYILMVIINNTFHQSSDEYRQVADRSHTGLCMLHKGSAVALHLHDSTHSMPTLHVSASLSSCQMLLLPCRVQLSSCTRVWPVHWMALSCCCAPCLGLMA